MLIIAFGAPTSSTSTFGFGTSTQNANLFGSTQAKPFGTSAQPLFGSSTNTTQSGFGTGLFGQTNMQVGNFAQQCKFIQIWGNRYIVYMKTFFILHILFF